jgi:hypothetical protein
MRLVSAIAGRATPRDQGERWGNDLHHRQSDSIPERNASLAHFSDRQPGGPRVPCSRCCSRSFAASRSAANMRGSRRSGRCVLARSITEHSQSSGRGSAGGRISAGVATVLVRSRSLTQRDRRGGAAWHLAPDATKSAFVVRRRLRLLDELDDRRRPACAGAARLGAGVGFYQLFFGSAAGTS